MRKSEVLLLWLKNSNFTGDFVIFDDDPKENYQFTYQYKINEKFILVDNRYGITDGDIKIAEKILCAQ